MIKNMKLNLKLGLGFGFVLGLTAIIAFVGIYGLYKVRDRVKKADDIANLVQWLFEARQQEKNFIIRGDKTYINQVKKQISDINSQIKITREKFKQNIHKEQIDKIVDKIEIYEKEFNGYVHLNEQREYLMEQMREKARLALDQAESIRADQKNQLIEGRKTSLEFFDDKLKKADDSNQLIKWFLEARHNEKEFIISNGEQKRKDSHQKLMSKIMELAADLRSRFKNDRNIKQIDDAVQAFKSYSISFNKLDITDQQISFINDMNISARIAMEHIDKIYQDQNEQLKTARRKSEAFLQDKLAKADDANRIIKWFLDARKNEKEVIISGERSYLDAVDDRIDEIINLGKNLKSRLKFEKNILNLDNTLAAINSYNSSFMKYIDVMEQQKAANKIMIQVAREAQHICKITHQDQRNKMLNEMKSSNSLIIIGTIFALVFGILAGYFITNNISVILFQIIDHLKEISKGNIARNVKFDLLNLKEEMGQLAKALQECVEVQRKKVRLAESIAEGNLNVRADIVSNKDLLGMSLQKMALNLKKLISQVNEAARQVSSGAGQISDSSQSLSHNTSEQAASLEQITSSISEIDCQTRSNADNAAQANKLAGNARDLAEHGKQEMSAMAAAMTDITKASQDIAKIIKVIDEIAFQTNLLSLNAAVEAARAGRHGKGFAVVAGEVRNLASRSAKAASETADLIQHALKTVENGNIIAEKTGGALNKIADSSVKMADLVDEISAASSEQADGISQINQGLVQVDQVTQQNAANAEETASAAEELSGQALQLQQMLSKFKLTENVKNNYSKTLVLETDGTDLSHADYISDDLKQSDEGQDNKVSDEIIALNDERFEEY